MKVIVIAAGRGMRLRDRTDNLPKCLISIAGKTLLQHQVDAFRENGLHEFVVIRGYRKERFPEGDYCYMLNKNFEENNILLSLMCAREKMEGAFLATYSDIVFRPGVPKALLDSPDDISIVVDQDWKQQYEGRTDHPESEAEKVVWDGEQRVRKIGKHLTMQDAPHGEFIGMLKCTGEGATLFRSYFEKAEDRFRGKPFMAAKKFEMAYITDFLQFLVEQGVSIQCVPIRNQWREIDTPQDLERAQSFFSSDREVR